jgi:peroxiredoxin
MSRSAVRSRPSKVERQAAARRRTHRRFLGSAILGVALVGVIVVVATTGGGSDVRTSSSRAVSIDRASGAQLQKGEIVPGFSAPALAGGRVEWSAYRGRPTVLAVWAPWCPHCQAELPRLSAAVAAHPGMMMTSVATAIAQEPGPSVAGYMSENGLTFPVAIDDAASTVGRGLGVTGFPLTYYVGSDGRVADVTVGEVPADQLEGILSALR